MADLLKPGQVAEESGQYVRRGPRGGYVDETEVTVVAGKRLPPTPQPNQRYELVDRTKHK